jgi:hypothetical protein
MNIALGIAILVALIFFIKYSNLKEKNKALKLQDIRQKNDLAIYFNTLLQYRDIIIKNNLAVPGDIQAPKNDDKSQYTIDSILDEIAEKGLENISEDKLEFLRNKHNGDKN